MAVILEPKPDGKPDTAHPDWRLPMARRAMIPHPTVLAARSRPDALATVPAADVVALMREAGLRRALVSSSDDTGTQALLALAPDIVVPSLRTYRARGKIGTWFRDPTVIDYLEQRLARHQYAAIGEFHLYGADADLPVPTTMVALARRHGLILHAHSDADAVRRLFRQRPEARVIWAHSGFDSPQNVCEMLRAHPKLWADLALRSDHACGERIDPAWREAFLEFPDRHMVGTDSFPPERLYYIPRHAAWARSWLATLPADVAERIGWRNADALLSAVWPPALTEADGGLIASGFNDAEIATILSHGSWPPAPRGDPTNRLSGHSAAIEPGRELFFDPACRATAASPVRAATIRRAASPTGCRAPSAWPGTTGTPRGCSTSASSAGSAGTAAMQACPPQARRGLAIFAGRRNCSICHAGAAFTNG